MVADIMVYMRGRRAVVVFHLERVFVMVVVSDAFLVYQRVPERQRLLADAHGCERQQHLPLHHEQQKNSTGASKHGRDSMRARAVSGQRGSLAGIRQPARFRSSYMRSSSAASGREIGDAYHCNRNTPHELARM